MPYHLLFPLFSSVCFVFGVMLAKQAFSRGVTPWTGTFLGNFWLAVFWGLIAAVRGQVIPAESWGIAAVIGLMFVLGQVFTYLAFQFGDVSVATPLFGLKVLMVAALSAFGTGVPVSGMVWLAGTLATAGVILIQWSGRKAAEADDAADTSNAADSTSAPQTNKLLTVVLALSAAFSLSLFDVCLQKWASDYSGYDFLPVMFGAAGLLSLLLLPFVTWPTEIRRRQAGRWIIGGTILMALQAMSMCYSLAEFGDAPRINIVYALRGLWGVLLAWAFAQRLQTGEASAGRTTMLRRLAGASLLTTSVLLAIGA
ncbi:MAG: hypothetical protein NXI04_25230 [Planctomycetaceae bacterium]|nr:hypothetical protein [Planctomycetaceae bacterium]